MREHLSYQSPTSMRWIDVALDSRGTVWIRRRSEPVTDAQKDEMAGEMYRLDDAFAQGAAMRH